MPDPSDVDRLLDEMDDVIADWRGSRDSASWSADGGWSRKPLSLALTEASGTASQAAEGFRQLGEALRRIGHAVAEFVQTPEWQEFKAAVERGEFEEEQDCHCLCEMRHPGEARCAGLVLASEVHTVRYGAVEVPMCAPCAGEEGSDVSS